MGRADAEVNLRVTGEDAGGEEVLRDAEDAAQDLGRAVDRVGDADGLEELARDAEETEKAFRKAERAFEAAVDRFKTAQLSPTFDEASKAAQRLRDNVVKTGRRLNDLAERVPPGLRKVGLGFDDVRKRVRAAEKSLKRFQTGASKGITGVLRTVTSLRTAVGTLQVAFGVAIAERFVSFLARASAEAVKLKTSIDLITPALKSNLGSTDAAANAQAFLASESDRLKVSINSLADNYVQLTAATKGTVIAGEETDRLFSAITEAGRVLGKSNEDISRAFLGLSQAAGGANVQMQEVRQITEAIPGLFAAWAAELGVTQQELRELIASAEVTADQLGTLADAAESLAGDTALSEQLDTTAGKLQALTVAIQNAQMALATELEPGLRNALEVLLEQEKAVGALAGALGTILSQELRETAAAFDFAVEAGKVFIGLLEDNLGEDAVKTLGLDRLRDDLEGVPEAAVEAFAALEAEALKSANAVKEGSDAVGIVAESFGDLPEAAKKAFRELADAAGLDAREREKIAQELAEEVGRITEKSVKDRQALQRLLVEAARAGAEEEKEVREAVAKVEGEIARRAIETTRLSIGIRIQEAEKLLAAEQKVNAERTAEFDKFLEAAKAGEQERVEAQTAAAANMEALEEQLSEKRQKLLDEFLEASRQEGEGRAEAVRKVEQEITGLAEDEVRKRIALSEKLLEQERKAAEERIALQEKVAEAVRQVNEDLRAAAAAPVEGGEVEAGGDAGAFEAQRQGIERLGESVEELTTRLEGLREVGKAAPGIDTPAILATTQALSDAVLPAERFGQVAKEAASDFASAQEEIKARSQEVLETIEEELRVNEELRAAIADRGAGFVEAFSGMVEATVQLQEAGALTNEDLTRLVETFALLSGETAPATVEAATSIQESLASLTEKAKEGTEAVEADTKARKAQVKIVTDAEGKITILQEATEALAETEKDAAKPTEEVAEIFKEAGEAAAEAAGPADQFAGGVDGIGEGAERAGEALPDLVDSARDLSDIPPPTAFVTDLRQMSEILPNLARDADQAAQSLGALAGVDMSQKIDELGQISALLDQIVSKAAQAEQSLRSVAEAEKGI
jgi:tape measure domain-containing protein